MRQRVPPPCRRPWTPLERLLGATLGPTLGLGALVAACAPETPPASPRAPLAAPAERLDARTEDPRPTVERPARVSPAKEEPRATATPSCAIWEGHKARGRERGKASYYSDSLAGRSTASGRPYRPEEFTAAHKSLPFGAVLRVIGTKTGKRTCVTVTDRGPFVRGRIVDLSRAAAEELGLLRLGVADVELEILEVPPPKAKKKRR